MTDKPIENIKTQARDRINLLVERGSEVAEVVHRVREGDTLLGKYRIDGVLGTGAMGVVVAAHHLALDTKVAIKFLLPSMLGKEEAVARFSREARAAAKITNEHVTRVLDVGTLETGTPFMVMEFLDGIDLHQCLHRHGPLGTEQAVDFVLQACEAIAEAHELGIVHRDLKPANLFRIRRADGRFSIKVLDFGISKVSAIGGSGSSMSMTGTAALMGTPLYMSPEQMSSSRGVDSRADIWALGVTLFELLTGEVPFFGEHLPEVCLKIATRAPPPVRSLRSDVPAEIEAAIFKCLEKDRSKRYATVAELCAAIAPFGISHSAASAQQSGRLPLVLGQSDTVAAPSSPLEAHGWRRTPSAESIGALGHTKTAATRRRTAALGLAGAGVALAALVAALLFTRTEKHPTTISADPRPSSSQVVGAASMAALPAPRPDPLPTVLPLPVADRALDLAPDPSARDASAPAKPATATQRAVLPPADVTRRATQAQAPQTPTHPDPSKGSAAYDERL